MLKEILKDWNEKYRPCDMESMVWNEECKELIEKYINDGIIDNIFICSPPGQGKTTLAKLLPKVFDTDYMYLNASDENNVEVVRTKVTNFAKTMSSNGKFKIVILDEADGFANVQAQRILRALMEEVSANTRFIITANHKNRIHEAVRSRCKMINITPPKDGVIKRVLYILKEENIKCKDMQSQIKKIQSLVDRFYPDVRSIIKNVQSCVFDGELKMKDFSIDSIFLQNILKLVIEKKATELRKYIISNENSFNNDYASLVSDFYHLMIDSDIVNDNLKPKWTIIIADYLYKFEEVIDPEINAFACFYNLMNN